MAAPEVVGAGESDDFLVAEAHAVEDEADVLGALGSVGESACAGS